VPPADPTPKIRGLESDIGEWIELGIAKGRTAVPALATPKSRVDHAGREEVN
jgi:hypothetical protein